MNGRRRSGSSAATPFPAPNKVRAERSLAADQGPELRLAPRAEGHRESILWWRIHHQYHRATACVGRGVLVRRGRRICGLSCRCDQRVVAMSGSTAWDLRTFLRDHGVSPLMRPRVLAARIKPSKRGLETLWHAGSPMRGGGSESSCVSNRPR